MKVLGKILGLLLAVLWLQAGAVAAEEPTSNEIPGSAAVRAALQEARGLSMEELYQRAAAEREAGHTLTFYSTTSVAKQEAEGFMRDYPLLAGSVTYRKIGDGETYRILSSAIGTPEEDKADMALVQNGPDLKAFLLDEGLSYSYFPEAMADKVEKRWQDPTVVTLISSLFVSNTSAGPTGFENVWQLTEPEWKGRFFMKTPLYETVNMNFLIMLTSPRWCWRLEEAYAERYGRAWDNGEHYQSAAYEWIDKFLQNTCFSFESNNVLVKNIAEGESGHMAIFGYSKVRRLSSEQLARTTAESIDKEIAGFSGFMYPIYATVCADTDAPYTCALFISYLLSEQGFSTPKGWNSGPGYYSPNKAILKPTQLKDLNLTDWDGLLVEEDPAYIDRNFMEVYEFVATRLLY